MTLTCVLNRIRVSCQCLIHRTATSVISRLLRLCIPQQLQKSDHYGLVDMHYGLPMRII